MTRIKLFLFTGLLGLIVLGGLYAKKKFYDPKYKLDNVAKQVAELSDQNQLKDGDIIFQTSLSQQSKAIQLATHSKYSHCGLIFKRKSGQDIWCVLEAVQPVKWTPLTEWINRGEGGHYVIKRLTTDPMIPDPMLDDLRKLQRAI